MFGLIQPFLQSGNLMTEGQGIGADVLEFAALAGEAVVNLVVMTDHEHAVGCEVHIEFNSIDAAFLLSAHEGVEGVFIGCGLVTGGVKATVGKEFDFVCRCGARNQHSKRCKSVNVT